MSLPEGVTVRGDWTGPKQLGGSLIEHAGRAYRLDAWPVRIRRIDLLDDGALLVHFARGHSRVLEPEFDALEAA